MGVREAGVYKCEITYLTSSPCPVVRLISRLVLIFPPTSVDLFTTRPQVRITNSTIGPFSEGQQVRLGCVSRGGCVSPAPSTSTREWSVVNLTLNTRPLMASMEIDINLGPVTTVIMAKLDREDLVS